MTRVDDDILPAIVFDPKTGKRAVMKRVSTRSILRALAFLAVFFLGACVFFLGLQSSETAASIVAVAAILLAVSPFFGRLVSRKTKRHSRRH